MCFEKSQNEAQDPRGSDDILIHSSILQITSYTNGIEEKCIFWNRDLKYHYVFGQSMTKLI